MRKLTVAAATIVGAVVVAGAQSVGDRPTYWPATTGAAIVDEWYSDIPWHQKLGTYVGNQIDQPLVLPYDAMPKADRDFCGTKGLGPQDCMIELGVLNVLGMRRIDTLYDTTKEPIKSAKECQDPALPCVEVKLELSSFWARSNPTKGIELVARPFGTDPSGDGIHWGGYVITDGSTYAPQMPWYMSHYCDSQFPSGIADVQDPVCYADYLSPMNSGFNALVGPLTSWPKGVPWTVSKATPQNHCAKDQDQNTCTMVMAAFDLGPVYPNLTDKTNFQYQKYNNFLFTWFNDALEKFPSDVGANENKRHFPWSGKRIGWEEFPYPQGVQNPFLGQFANVPSGTPVGPNCDIDLKGPTIGTLCNNTGNMIAATHLYPRKCELGDLAGNDVSRLRKCSLNFELHHNGYDVQWPPDWWPDIPTLLTNQYGRTSFLFGGVHGMQMPVSFAKAPATDSGLNVYEQTYNASIFSLYLPYANVADVTRAYAGRQYTDTEFYHTLLMSNHNESDPWQFADGIRGKVLWHNEYRTQQMYEIFRTGTPPQKKKFDDMTFAAAFKPENAKSPWHNHTCDGCHVRNGSGVPIKQDGTLDPQLQEFMTNGKYSPFKPGGVKDYTFTGEIYAMKLVFFDLRRPRARVDASIYSEPLSFLTGLLLKPPRNTQPGDLYYKNKIMNFYGDSFHATTPGYAYTWSYKAADASRIVVNVPRTNLELGKTYVPQEIQLGTFTASQKCEIVTPAPPSTEWPATCNDIGDTAIQTATKGGEVGFMLLNGKRLGNLGAMEAIPNQSIIDFRDSQKALLGDAAGELVWNAGSRDGVGGKVQKDCRTSSLQDCYIGRFGWIGDRVSLEDQVANAAFVEMNMTTKKGYEALYGNTKPLFPIRYPGPNCGPANKTCVTSTGNADLSERDVERMADYARWLGNPTRSDFLVSLPEVVAGEKIFKQVKCDTCHVIKRIDIVPEDTMLTKNFRDRLKTRVAFLRANRPFLSYIGTDLLMHDMGYLSQVGISGKAIRDANGVVLTDFQNYVQKIRTPALKGLQFNRFVTDSHNNTKNVGKKPPDPACDFLLHDGRACDAIEAAFLHDGPAIRKLGVIDGLNNLSAQQVLELRAFLYSL